MTLVLLMKNKEFDPANERSLLDPHTSSSNALTEFLQSTVYAAVEAPSRALAQVVDHSAGTKIESAIQDGFKALHIEEPKQAVFGTDKWYAQQLGSACGMVLPLVLLRGAAKGAGNALLESEIGLSSNSCIGKFALDTSAKAILTKEVALSGAVGGTYGALLTPSDQTHVGKKDFLSDRLKHGANDMLLFSALGLTNHVAGASLSKVATSFESKGLSTGIAAYLPAVLRSPITSGAISGVPAGIASAELGAWSNGQAYASADQLKENIVAMSFIGGAFGSAAHLTKGKLLQQETKPEHKSVAEKNDSTSAKSESKPSEDLVEKTKTNTDLIDLYLSKTDPAKAQEWAEKLFSTSRTEVQSEVLNPDGSKIRVWDEGFKTVDSPDGSTNFFAPDGTFILNITRLPGNRRLERYGSGAVEIRTKEGSLLESTEPDGSYLRIEKPAKGIERRTERDSEGKETTFESYRFKQGELKWIDSIETRPDGSKTVQYIRGNEYHQRPDGTGEYVIGGAFSDPIGFHVGVGEVKFEYDYRREVGRFSCTDGTVVESSPDYYSFTRPDGQVYTKTAEKIHTIFPDGRQEHDYKNGLRFIDNNDGTATIKHEDGSSTTLGMRKILANDDYFVFYEQGVDAKQLFKSMKFFDTRNGQEQTQAKMYRANEFLQRPGAEALLNAMPSGCVPLGFGHLRFAFLSPSGDVLCIGPNVERPSCPALLQAKERKVFGGYQIETLDYADHNITEAERKQLYSQFMKFSETDKRNLSPSEWYLIDYKDENVGRLADGRIVVIDPDCMDLVNTQHWLPLFDNRKIEISYRRAIDQLLKEGNTAAAAKMYKRLEYACWRQGRDEQAEWASARAKELGYDEYADRY